MSLYTIIFILVTVLILVGIAIFGLLITKLDKWIDRKERLGKNSIYQTEKKQNEVEIEN
jgi:hypothetical protein